VQFRVEQQLQATNINFVYMWGKPVLNNVVVQIETEKPYQVSIV